MAWRYGVDHADVAAQPTGEVLLLGLGSTAAVGPNAAVQWWGARRVGVRLAPSAGWRDPEVRAVLRRAVRSVGQAGMLALQMLALLLVANRVEGTVAVQIALNFYYLPIAIVATPVALALLPRLSRLVGPGVRRASPTRSGTVFPWRGSWPFRQRWATSFWPIRSLRLWAAGQMATLHMASP